jgi:uncharacterized Zn-binding protein involved in type VI secretion
MAMDVLLFQGRPRARKGDDAAAQIFGIEETMLKLKVNGTERAFAGDPQTPRNLALSKNKLV